MNTILHALNMDNNNFCVILATKVCMIFSCYHFVFRRIRGITLIH